MSTLSRRGGRNVRSRQAGFSLIEVVVALAVSALCVLILSGIVARLTTARRIVRDHATALDESDAIFRLIGGLVGSVETELQGADAANIRGEAERLEVRSRGPAVLGISSETAFTVHLVPAGGRRDAASAALALAWISPGDQTPVDAVIASDLSSFRLTYRAKGAAGLWSDSWSGRVADLSLIRATIVFAADRGAKSASAVFAVHGKLPQRCVVDPSFDRCPSW